MEALIEAYQNGDSKWKQPRRNATDQANDFPPIAEVTFRSKRRARYVASRCLWHLVITKAEQSTPAHDYAKQSGTSVREHKEAKTAVLGRAALLTHKTVENS